MSLSISQRLDFNRDLRHRIRDPDQRRFRLSCGFVQPRQPRLRQPRLAEFRQLCRTVRCASGDAARPSDHSGCSNKCSNKCSCGWRERLAEIARQSRGEPARPGPATKYCGITYPDSFSDLADARARICDSERRCSGTCRGSFLAADKRECGKHSRDPIQSGFASSNNARHSGNDVRHRTARGHKSERARTGQRHATCFRSWQTNRHSGTDAGSTKRSATPNQRNHELADSD